MYFPGKKGRPAKHPLYEELCGSCPVRNFCANYGLVHDEEGVWGGLTKNQRDRLSPQIREAAIQEAKNQGWYETRLSVDEILRYHPKPIEESQFDLIEPAAILQNYVTSLLLPEESELEPPLPNVQPESYEDSMEYPSAQIAS